MAKPKDIELNNGKTLIPILYEDRSVLAVDKPAGWMLAPDSWDKTGRNLQLALQSSLNAGDFWAHSRNIKFLRYVHRLDAETTGVLLLCKSLGALRAYGELFETRSVEKFYLAVVQGIPKQSEWTCKLPLIADPVVKGKMQVVTPGKPLPKSDPRGPQAELKDAETHFRVIQTLQDKALVEAQPMTGRTHQIRVHLAASGHPIVGDPLYGNAPAAASKGAQIIALRAIKLIYWDPFQKRQIRIAAPTDEFLKMYGFESKPVSTPTPQPELLPKKVGTRKPSHTS
ncbi:RluA family pseudouridine synthase [Pedosphaera parvula]|uniref:Pseudouridine synthase n=1 Tax=Pedosphaera parvula (strain Ellin514) TaxID=320771 RepID=B9XDK1_PEDPL|nr:RluA family pseudouridine synthase [Pedosphaera parvula]EEF62147.1 pseudouridine synthase [Pedosphaera parvula Ellin514]